jgi:4'-phosphopantetheinyl transferase
MNKHEIHIYNTNLDISSAEENEALLLLSSNEVDRANHFHFPIHRTRFIAARSTLRYLLSHYLSICPKEILFSYTEFGKPYLQISNLVNNIDLQFNLSHSENQAIYAFTLGYQLGIDIEKIRPNGPLAVAERYFHPCEIKYLHQLPPNEQEQVFYRIWSRKEAILKAIGDGLATPLSSFSVSIKNEEEIIVINNQSWSLLPIHHPSYPLLYQAALATNQPIETIKIIYKNNTLWI